MKLLTSSLTFAILMAIPLLCFLAPATGMDLRCGEPRILTAEEGSIFPEGEGVRPLHATGEIVRGDRDKFERFIQEGDCAWHDSIGATLVLHLDSAGGSFDEAVEIGLMLKPKGIRTLVDRDGVCKSACAIIFMAGHAALGSSRLTPWRRMHPTAQVGFHAPFLRSSAISDLPDVALRPMLPEFYRNAQLTVARLMLLSAEGSWSPLLVKAILDTPSNAFQFVNTLDRAARWDIGLLLDKAAARETFDNFDFAQSCLNFHAWSDVSAAGPTAEMSDPQYVEARVQDVAESVGREPVEGGETIRIGSDLHEDGQPSCGWQFTYGDYVELPDYRVSRSYRQIPLEYSSLPATTPLAGLREAALAAKAATGGKRRPVFAVIDRETLRYDHQGSAIRAEFHSISRTTTHVVMTYEAVAPDAAALGIAPGTHFLEGNIEAGQLEGWAPQHDSACPMFSNVGLSGVFDPTAEFVELIGRAPSYDQNCGVAGYDTDNPKNRVVLRRVP
jgi:hypothetical protein